MEASAILRQKSIGAFYTPPKMATKLVDWAIRDANDRVLDPSFGGLVFLAAAHDRLADLGAVRPGNQLYGCDLDEEAHAAIAAHCSLGVPDAALIHRDFFELVPDADLPLAQAVVGNPPYIRYQLHNESGAPGRAVATNAGLDLSRLASSWAPFVLHAADFVAPGGRLALVLPAELLHAQYASDVLAWVQQRFARTALVVFEQRVFPGALEEVVLLFADGRGQGTSSQVPLLECDTLNDLDITMLEARLGAPPPKAKGRGKLLSQLLSSETRALYERLAGDGAICRLGDCASVDIGAVTGANNFFLLTADEEPHIAGGLLRPAVGKAMHIRGARLTEADYERLLDSGARCRMFVAPRDISPELLATAATYLERGIDQRIIDRYKCRVREPWWSIPIPKHGAPDLLLTYFAAEAPRLVSNEMRALHTNTLHGVTLHGNAPDASTLAAGFSNSLTLLSVELVGRSYGGGVLKLEPTEAEAVLIPALPEGLSARLGEIDALVRSGDLEATLDLVDQAVLVDGLGLSAREVALLRAGADRLRSRRRARGKTPK